MPANRTTLIAVALFVSSLAQPAHAEIYRCTTPSGRVLLTDTACADNPMAAKPAPAQQSDPVPLPSRATPAKAKPAIHAMAAPLKRAPSGRAQAAPAAAPAPARPAAAQPAQGGDGAPELAELAYLRAIGEICPLPVEHTQMLRFLDILANDRLESQGIHLTTEQIKSIGARARDHAQRDAADHAACADADRRLVALGQTRVQFGTRTSAPK